MGPRTYTIPESWSTSSFNTSETTQASLRSPTLPTSLGSLESRGPVILEFEDALPSLGRSSDPPYHRLRFPRSFRWYRTI
ncbi:hypothetical protein VTJ83DRAFT_2869 [Remersonia thermophila]|uniref:Uncharacterized protein n=1 Tax=Remersonia thermophila TaxID=72144 RepID=A0ABR4DCG0_9PEZI